MQFFDSPSPHALRDSCKVLLTVEIMPQSYKQTCLASGISNDTM